MPAKFSIIGRDVSEFGRTMKKLVFIGSHLGYPMDRTPLGGGAMVGLQLVRHWKGREDFELTVLGSGSEPPAGIEYHQFAGRAGGGLVQLSELAYARFCRQFEAETTQWVLKSREGFDPRETCVVVNDISEGPAVAALSQAGYPIVSLWHVDVVDYFNKLYLRRLVLPERLTRLYERSRRLGISWILPDLLRLIFEKQRETVLHSRRMILPSRAMARTLERCYGMVLPARAFAERCLVVPWGVWREVVPEAEVAEGAARLRRHYQIRSDTAVLVTLSRISPEKGLHLLLEALGLLEREGAFPGRDLCLFICGEPAFMQGASYMRRVRAAALGLRRFRVFFPGYLSPAEKRMFLGLAQLFVSPSIHESYGLNIVEAMQAGLPILASDHYGVRDLLDGSFGRMVHYPSPAKAPRRLAEALKECLSDPARLKAMGAAAREAASRMPFGKAADTVLKTALSLIGDGAAAGAARTVAKERA